MDAGPVQYGSGSFDYGHVLTVDPGSGLGFAVVTAAGTGSSVREYDLARHQIMRDIPAPPAGGFGQGDGAGPHRPLAVVDGENHTVIFAEYNPTQPAPGSCSAGSDNLAVLDERAAKWSTWPLPCLPGEDVGGVPGITPGDDVAVSAMTYDSAHKALYLVFMDLTDESHSPQPGTVAVRHYLAQLDASSGHILWQTAMPDCDTQTDFNNTDGSGTSVVGRHNDLIDVVCAKSSSQQEVTSKQAVIPVLIRLEIKEEKPAGAPTTSALLGSTFGTVFDSADGLPVIISNLPGFDYGAYVVDGETGLFRGFVATGNDTSANGPDEAREVGLDPSRGRLYMRTQRGLIVADVGHRPLPAGISLDGLADPWDYPNQGGMTLPIAIDAQHHELYMFNRATGKYLIYRDDAPALVPSSTANPDAATTNVQEAAGVTGVTYSGAGDAFGARFLSEGGVNRVVNSQTACVPGGKSPTTTGSALLDPLLIAAQGCPGDVTLSPGDRNWVFGDVAQLSSSTVGVASQAAALDIDDSATAQDFNRAGVYGTQADPSPVPAPPLSVPGPGSSPSPDVATHSRYLAFPADRPQERPRCFDAGGTSGTAREQNGVGAAVVTCNQSGATVAATAVAGPGGPSASSATATPSPGPVNLGEYWSQVQSFRDPAKGLVTEATADAHNVEIPIVGGSPVFIRELVTTAVVRAHGRPGTAEASFSRSIYGFVSTAQPGTPGDYSCSDGTQSPCNPQMVAAAITYDLQQAGFDAVATVPTPEAADLHGSPGGYQAAATKDSALQANDRTVNDDLSDTVDGLQIVFIEDGLSGKAREVLQLAGVHAESHYGIYLLTAADGSFGGGDGGSTPSATNVDSGPTGTASVGGPPPPPPPPPNNGPNPIVAVIHHIADAIREGWRLLVSDPKTAAMLAGVWGLLGSPVYLAVRRRSLRGKVARGVG